jgi:hypothetical protein
MKFLKYRSFFLMIGLIFMGSLHASDREDSLWEDRKKNPGRYAVKVECTESGTTTTLYKVGSIERRFKEKFSEDSQNSTQEIPGEEIRKRKIRINREIEIEPSTQEVAPKHTMAGYKGTNRKKLKSKSTILATWNTFNELMQSAPFHNFKQSLLKATNGITTIVKAATPNEDGLNSDQQRSLDKLLKHTHELTHDKVLKYIEDNTSTVASLTENILSKEDFKIVMADLKNQVVTRFNNDMVRFQEKGIYFDGESYRDYSNHREYFNATISDLATAIDNLANS